MAGITKKERSGLRTFGLKRKHRSQPAEATRSAAVC